MSIRGRQLKRRDKISRNGPCPCKSGLKYKQCHGSTRNIQLCRAAVDYKLRDLLATERRTRYFKVWRLLWWLVWVFRIRRPMCPCGSGLRHRYCHGSQKKANACRDTYTSRMKQCIYLAKANKFVPEEHKCVDSKDRAFENVNVDSSKKGQ